MVGTVITDWGLDPAAAAATAALLEQIFTAGYSEAVRAQLKIGVFNLPNTRAANWAQKEAGQLVSEVDQTTKDRIGALVADVLRDPTASQADLASRIRAEFADMSSARADTIARNETHQAAAAGDIAAYKDYGVTEVTISDGTDYDEECAEADGQTWTLDEYEANPQEHVNCGRVGTAVLPDGSEGEEL